MSLRTPYPDWIERLLSSKQYSDCIIECRDEKFYVHKAVVCTQSPVIAAAMDGQFRESRTEIMHLFSFDVETVKRMIDYMYTGQFHGDLENKIVNKSQVLRKRKRLNSDDQLDALLKIRIQMHAIADYLEISGLRKHSIESICHILGVNWSMERFLQAMKTTLKTTKDADLFEAMATVAADHIKELLDSEEFVQLDMPNRMTLGIARELAKAQPRSRRYPYRCCSQCRLR